LRENIAQGLSRVLRSAVDLSRSALAAAALKTPEGRANGDVIAFLGAKGGVGTTTVALNIAALLASRGTVILAEMRPAFGSLASHLQPHGLTRNLSHCLTGPTGSTDAGAALWTYKNVPGLSILFGPQTVAECAEIEPARAKFIIQSLSGLADYVIVDLPASLSEANRAVIEQSGSMALVVEGDPVCVRLAGPVARAIESWSATQNPVGAVIVNRASVGCAMPLSEIGNLLQRHVQGVIPPAADLCLRAQTTGVPLVALHPESLIAASLSDLSEVLAPARRAVPFHGLGSDRFQP
jgi:pilus assembly protein CpaE